MDVNDHREEGQYVDGERHGIWIHTFPNGTEQFKGEFEMGLPIGGACQAAEALGLFAINTVQQG